MQRVALIAGASGLIGRRIAAHLAAAGWKVTGLSRRPDPEAAIRQIAIDLVDVEDARRKLAAERDVTHVFYAARHDHPEGAVESETINTAMLRNVLEAMLRAAPRLAHVNLVHGTKYYGHPARIPVPVTEESPRGPGPTFYFAQEDLIRERAHGRGWGWSIARPHIFCDASPGNPRSIGLVIAVLAAIQRELGQPLFFPGSAGSFASRTQFTDLALLARAVEWMATDARCANQAFNIVNGDSPRWSELWPDFARALGVEAGEPRPLRLGEYVADKGPLWDAIVAKHGLRRTRLSSVALWDYGDYVFRPEWDIMSSMDKARRFGFDERADSRDTFAHVFAAYRERRIIP